MKTALFNKKLEELNDLLFAFAMKLTKNRNDAKDLCQETVTRAYANKHRFKVGTNFKAWMTTIMRNNFINEYRKKRTRNRVEQPLENNSEYLSKNVVRNNGSSMIMLEELEKMLKSIDEQQRVPFEMYFNGFNYKEIALKLNLPMGTVKSRIFFTRKKMKNMIKAKYGTLNFRRA